MSTQETVISIRFLIFSGRPDPVWALEEQEARELAERVRQTVAGEQVQTEPLGGLGYRGFMVRAGKNSYDLPAEFSVYQGVLTLQPGARAVHWRDNGGVEEWLLAQARERGYSELLDWGGSKGTPTTQS